jgi:hypothetical protein
MGRLTRRLLGIPEGEVDVARRGFVVADPATRERLETIGRSFLHGYHAALETGGPETVVTRLDDVALELRGFAYEGAAMAFACLDRLLPWRRDRLRTFLDSHGSRHTYMLHVGTGCAVARLHLPLGRALARFDPLLRWLVVDGFGFHEGYFHPRRAVGTAGRPRRLTGYQRRAFDQGVGRSLWFSCGADARRVSAVLATFAPQRRADLWSGVGLACAYAGGADRSGMRALCDVAQPYGPEVAQGAAFAAKARELAGNPAWHTEMACNELCGMPATDAARITDLAIENLPPDESEPAYEVWRRRIRVAFNAVGVQQ